MTNKFSALIAIVGLSLTAARVAAADPLTLQVEEGLAALGYDTGPADGEETLDTIIAISKFQAENDIAVTGEVTPELAQMFAGDAPSVATSVAPPGDGSAGASGNSPSSTSLAPVAPDASALQAAQQACLEQKVADTQGEQLKQRRFGRLIGAVTRTAVRAGGNVSGLVSGVFSAKGTIDDAGIIAEELGLTEDDVEACRDPLP